MRLSSTDKIEVFQRCLRCFGEKVVKDDAGNETPCTSCNGAGEVTERVTLSDFVDFIGNEMAKMIRLRTGVRF
jgi:DnaJ-class molecular chaperone